MARRKHFSASCLLLPLSRLKRKLRRLSIFTKGDRDVTKGARPGLFPGLFDPVFSLPGSVMQLLSLSHGWVYWCDVDSPRKDHCGPHRAPHSQWVNDYSLWKTLTVTPCMTLASTQSPLKGLAASLRSHSFFSSVVPVCSAPAEPHLQLCICTAPFALQCYLAPME